MVFATEQEPTDQHLLSDAFGPAALAIVRPEVEHLLSGALHLGGESGYDLTVLVADFLSADQAQVTTRERWTYDERDDND